MKFLLVKVQWFATKVEMFSVEELLDCETERQAEEKRLIWLGQQSGGFYPSGAKIIEVFDNETVEKRKLTWKERLLGRLVSKQPLS